MPISTEIAYENWLSDRYLLCWALIIYGLVMALVIVSFGSYRSYKFYSPKNQELTHSLRQSNLHI
jgi:hypothetical protein